jgi:hypothetical protein
MSVHDLSPELRTRDVFHTIDPGFLNRRLCMTALPPDIRKYYIKEAKPGTDHMTVLANDHLLVTILLDVCQTLGVPTLLEALALGKPKHLFRSTERLSPCPEVYDALRVDHAVQLDVDFGKPVRIAYHTEHLVSSTGKMTLAEGTSGGYVQSVVGLLHDKGDRFEIEPLVMGAPWFDHPRNGNDGHYLIWAGQGHGEILPEDIDQFSRMTEVTPATAEEWLEVMCRVPEVTVKRAFACLLSEPTKKDWGGETNDHFSGNVTIAGHRKTAAFLLKGPTMFREMTLDMCGKRADQIYRLTQSGADISIVQHSHLVGEAVRATLRSMTVYPGQPRKYCLIDGQSTYRILKAYSLLPT